MKQNKKSAKKVATKQQPAARAMVKPIVKAVPAPEQPKVHADDLVLFGKVTRPSVVDGDTFYHASLDEIPCKVFSSDFERGWRYYPHIPEKGSPVVLSFEFPTKEQARDALEAEIQARLARAARQAGGRVQWTATTTA